MDVTQTKLYADTQAGGFQPLALTGPTGGLLITQRGARVLGVFLDGVADNLYWTNPAAVGDAGAAKAAVSSGEWNVGGDRVWLSPEIELHFLNPAQPHHTNYAVPADLDPGQYVADSIAKQGILFASEGGADNLVSGKPFQFTARRQITLCAPPVDPGGLSYVGYELSSMLKVSRPDRPEACYGLWQLLQIPPGGTIYIPTQGDPEPIDYFQTGVSGHVQRQSGTIAFPVTGTEQHKLGLRPDHVRGLMGYYRRAGDQATLIVRQAAVFPGAIYADYPAHARERRDVALQFYNDGGDAGGFGELEYHSTAAVARNFYTVRDVSRTWCFGGPADEIRDLARRLLGVADVQ